MTAALAYVERLGRRCGPLPTWGIAETSMWSSPGWS